jgi:acyl dehydratase
MSIAEEIIGTHYRYPDYFLVDREKVREFARSVKDEHPAHYTEEAAAECGQPALIASLTFVAVAGRRVQAEIFQQFDVPINMERVLHRDQKLVFHRPIVVGDKLWFDSYLDWSARANQHRHPVRRVDQRRRERRSDRTDRRRPRCRHEADDCRANQGGGLIEGFSLGTDSCGWPAADTGSAGWSRGPDRSARR